MGRAEELHTCSRNCTQGDVETGWMLDKDPIPHVQVIRRRWKWIPVVCSSAVQDEHGNGLLWTQRHTGCKGNLKRLILFLKIINKSAAGPSTASDKPKMNRTNQWLHTLSSHRIHDWFGLEGISQAIQCHPYHGQEHLPLDQGAPSPSAQPGRGHLQGQEHFQGYSWSSIGTSATA